MYVNHIAERDEYLNCEMHIILPFVCGYSEIWKPDVLKKKASKGNQNKWESLSMFVWDLEAMLVAFV